MKTKVEDLVLNIKSAWSIHVFLLCGAIYFKERFDHLERTSWTIADQQDWARQAQMANTNAHVPDPNDIFRRNHPSKLMPKEVDMGFIAKQLIP